MALSADRGTPERAGDVYEFTPNSGAVIYRGALVALNAGGFLVPGSTSTTLKAVGRAETGTADINAPTGRVKVRRGVFRFKNSASSDAITDADWGANVYIVDDETVAKTNGSTTRSVAGICRGVDADGVWVEI